jgi:hypothetical protein
MMLVALALSHAQAAPVAISAVESKSDWSKGGTTYAARNVMDKKSKPWFEGDPGSGVGSWISVDLGGAHTVTKIGVFAGDWSSGTSWKQTNRPKELEVQYSDGTTESWTLADEMKMQVFTPSSPKSTSSIRFKVNQIFNGSAFPDTAISEIMVWDDQADPNPAVRQVVASSEAPADGDGSYAAVQAADGLSDTFWCEGNKGGDGTGETLEFVFDRSATVGSMSICNGMCAVGVQGKGNVPNRATLTFSDGSSQTVDLTKSIVAQKIAITPPRTTTSVKLRIDGVVKGTEFDDACISEVSFTK